MIARFNDEKSAMKLVFAVLIRASERWNRVFCLGAGEQAAEVVAKGAWGRSTA